MATDEKPPPRKRAPRKAAKKAPAKKAAPRKVAAKRAPRKSAPHLRVAAEGELPPQIPRAEIVPVNHPDPELPDQAALAHSLRLRGATWPSVVEDCGYPSVGAAHAAVTNYLQRAAMARSAESREVALQTQVDRYEELLRNWWDLATTMHDKDAAAVVLKTLGQLDRVQKLDEMGEGGTTRQVLVIAGNEAEYVAQMRAAYEADHGATD